MARVLAKYTPKKKIKRKAGKATKAPKRKQTKKAPKKPKISRASIPKPVLPKVDVKKLKKTKDVDASLVDPTYSTNVNYQRAYEHRKAQAAREIQPLPVETIDWDVRLACKHDFKLFCETYGKAVFFLPWSEPQLKCIEKLETVCTNSGVKHAFAMPRGGGKTAICRLAIIWCTAYGHKRYPIFIGSRQDASEQTLDFIKRYWFANPLLLRDFPEIAYPIFRIENRFHMAKGQLYNNELTSIQWGSDAIRYPSLILPRDVSDFYRSYDPKSVQYIKDRRQWTPVSSGIKIECAGIDGSIRGKAEVNPITLEQMRPDLALLDDVQKDQKADSPIMCEKMTILIDGAIRGLAGPEEGLSCLMPCTVIREGDVSDTYLTPTKKPEWQGERTKMVTSWPPGITDHEITMEHEPSKRWNEYTEIRRKSLRLHGDISLATNYYQTHQKVMDENFVCTWKERFVKKGKNAEISAQQNAINLRLENPITFPSEYQNIGRIEDKNLVQMITADQLKQRTVHLHRFQVPLDTQYISTFIDVQDEMFFYATLAVSPDFTGIITDYGTYPEVKAPFFQKSQTQAWNMCSRDFFKAYPEYKNRALTVRGGKPKAPLDEKIRYGLEQCIKYLKTKRYVKDDEQKTELLCNKFAIDARWGQAADSILRFIREYNDPNLLAYLGFSISPVNKQLDEYTRTGQYRSWLFEDQVSPRVEKVKWCLRPGKDGRPYIFADVDLLKDFVMSRLGVAPGARGSICLFHQEPDLHSLFASHVCSSEYPEPIEGRGVKKNKWLMRDGRPDNDWLDCLVGAAALCTFQGAFIHHGTDKSPQKIKRSLSSLHRRKRAS